MALVCVPSFLWGPLLSFVCFLCCLTCSITWWCWFIVILFNAIFAPIPTIKKTIGATSSQLSATTVFTMPTTVTSAALGHCNQSLRYSEWSEHIHSISHGSHFVLFHQTTFVIIMDWEVTCKQPDDNNDFGWSLAWCNAITLPCKQLGNFFFLLPFFRFSCHPTLSSMDGNEGKKKSEGLITLNVGHVHLLAKQLVVFLEMNSGWDQLCTAQILHEGCNADQVNCLPFYI